MAEFVSFANGVTAFQLVTGRVWKVGFLPSDEKTC
jgi:hypothetical protein